MVDGDANFGVTLLAVPHRILESCQILLHGSTSLGLVLVPVLTWDRPLLVGIRDDQPGIDREVFAADQACRDTRLHHALEYTPCRPSVPRSNTPGSPPRFANPPLSEPEESRPFG